MLEVEIDKILPLTEAHDNFNKIVDEVESSDAMYVLTKNGKPSAVVVGVHHLEKLTGKSPADLTAMVEDKADSTPIAEAVPPMPSEPISSAPVEPTVPETEVPVVAPIETPQPSVTPQPTTPPVSTPPAPQPATPPTTNQNDDLFV